MIKLLRVDHRLLHGQVAISWTKSLDVDAILIANDNVVKDDIRKMSLKLARPNGVKLVIKNIDDSIASINEGKTDKYKLLIVVESVKDACILSKRCGINSINLGGTKANESTSNISKAVNLTSEEITSLNELIDEGVEVEIRMVPEDKKIIFKGK